MIFNKLILTNFQAANNRYFLLLLPCLPFFTNTLFTQLIIYSNLSYNLLAPFLADCQRTLDCVARPKISKPWLTSFWYHSKDPQRKERGGDNNRGHQVCLAAGQCTHSAPTKNTMHYAIKKYHISLLIETRFKRFLIVCSTRRVLEYLDSSFLNL